MAKNYREFAILGGNEVIESTRNGYEPHAVLGYLTYAQHLGVEVNTNEIKVSLPETSEESKNKIDELLKNIDKSKQTNHNLPYFFVLIGKRLKKFGYCTNLLHNFVK